MQHDRTLVVEDLHVHYGDSHVLRGVSLVVARGEAVALLGRNGAGKTTLLRAVVGQLRATSGCVVLDGTDVTNGEPDMIARAGVAFVPEGRAIFPNLTVRENLLVAARPSVAGGDAWPLSRILATFPRLRERLAHPGNLLSGGEQQMLAIGRALSTNPRLLIIDEATEGLAPLLMREFWRVIDALRVAGVATLLVDRNYGALLAHADRACVLASGTIALAGLSAEVASRKQDLAALLGVGGAA